MPLAVTVSLIVLCVTLVGVFIGYLVHKNADRHDSEGGR
jgi:F0F1-type ATP synthase assembly protein I